MLLFGNTLWSLFSGVDSGSKFIRLRCTDNCKRVGRQIFGTQGYCGWHPAEVERDR